MRKLTTQEFIAKAIIIHGNKYDYSNVDYVANNIKILIKCPLHGSFKQSPMNHLNKHGCPRCKIIQIQNALTSNTKKFIQKAIKIHGPKYNYSEVKYVNCMKKVIINCLKNKHKFFQTPNEHLSGRGCPKCIHTISKMEIQFLDYINIPDTKETRQVKILSKKADGYDPYTKTIYEFLGNYWHGNPSMFNSNDYNKICHQTHGELYRNTLNKFKMLKNDGYNIKYIWERDWKNFKKGIDTIPKILEYN